MSFTINTKTYELDAHNSPNNVAYRGPAHTGEIVDQVNLSRQQPKPTATFRGIKRGEVKLTRTMTLDDGSKVPAIGTISCGVPVGSAIADQEAFIADLYALAAADGVAEKVVTLHDIVQ